MIPKNLLDKTNTLDAVAEEDDGVQVEVVQEIGLDRCYKVYVHINGQTILRLWKVKNIEMTLKETLQNSYSFSRGKSLYWKQ